MILFAFISYTVGLLGVIGVKGVCDDGDGDVSLNYLGVSFPHITFNFFLNLSFYLVTILSFDSYYLSFEEELPELTCFSSGMTQLIGVKLGFV